MSFGECHQNRSRATEAQQEDEAQHFASICWAMAMYKIEALAEVAYHERMLRSLPNEDADLLIESIDTRIDIMKSSVLINQALLDIVLERMDSNPFTLSVTLPPIMNIPEAAECKGKEVNKGCEDDKVNKVNKGCKGGKVNKVNKGGEDESNNEDEDECYSSDISASDVQKSKSLTPLYRDRDAAKVRSTLRQFVRDWCTEGQEERKVCYDILLNDLKRNVPLTSHWKLHGSKPRVLVPGCGLGRLPFEVAKLGYDSQGNEFSYHMLMCSNLILNTYIPREGLQICPFVLQTTNMRNYGDNTRTLRIPDVEINSPDHPICNFSMWAGEFVAIYYNRVNEWDAVLTSFFLDTARNVIQYIRTIARILKPGGLWANIGPLLYHFAETEETSIELSWSEVKTIIEKWFLIEFEDCHSTVYASNRLAMMNTNYDCVHFRAIRLPGDF